MSEKNFKVYKNIPIKYKIQKPKYWYKEKEITPKVDGEVFEEVLEAFEGVYKQVLSDEDTVKIEKTKLWNGLEIEANEYAFAPKGEKYLARCNGVEYVKNGNLGISDGVVSGFSMSDYLAIPQLDFNSANAWEIKLKYKPTNLSSGQFLFCSAINGDMYGIAFGIEQGKAEALIAIDRGAWDAIWSYELEVNTWQYVKIVFDSSGYRVEHSKDDIEYVVKGSLETTKKISLALHHSIIGYLSNYSYAGAWSGEFDLNESYIKFDGRVVWGMGSGYKIVKSFPGCGILGIKPNNSYLTYVMYRDKSDGGLSIGLAENYDDNGEYIAPDDKDWFGYVVLPPLFNPVYHLMKFNEINNPIYSLDGDNVLVNLYDNKALELKEPYYYPIQKPAQTFVDYDIRFTTRVKTNANNEYARIIVPGGDGFDQHVLINYGKFGINTILLADSVLDVGVFYWVRVAETFDASTRQFTHRIAYIEDNGYAKDTLPDESLWNVKTLTDSSPWFVTDKPLEKIGFDSNDNQSWNGEIDITNTWIDFGVKNELLWMYETKWRLVGDVVSGGDYDVGTELM